MDARKASTYRAIYSHFQWKAIELHNGMREEGVRENIRSTGDDVVMAFCAATCWSLLHDWVVLLWDSYLVMSNCTRGGDMQAFFSSQEETKKQFVMDICVSACRVYDPRTNFTPLNFEQTRRDGITKDPKTTFSSMYGHNSSDIVCQMLSWRTKNRLYSINI